MAASTPIEVVVTFDAAFTATQQLVDERDKLREALSRLLWEVRHRERPKYTFAFHKAEELIGGEAILCDWTQHNTDMLRHWGETR